MKTHSTSLLLVATMTMALATVACGDEVTFQGDGGGGAGATGGAGGNGGSGGNGGNGGSGGDVCEAFLDATGESVTFRIHNDTPQTMFVPTSCGLLVPEILPQSGADGTYYGNAYDDGCFSTCETLQETEPAICAAEACAETVLEILPGQSHDFVWQGVGMIGATMPMACFFSSDWGDQCTQVVEAAAQPMTFEVVAYDSCAGQGEPDCICEDNGQCWGSPSGQMAMHAPVLFEHGSDTLVDVVFEECAFGCP